MSGLSADFVVTRPDGFRLHVAVDVPAGTTAALLGPNGAGKSTTVAAIAGLIPIGGGQVSLGDTVFDDPRKGVFLPAEERNVGVVFQGDLLFKHMSVLDNVVFGLRARGVGRAAAEEQGRDWLHQLGLEGFEQRRPGDLSGGQAQRVALARALVVDPDLLLLDEPLSSLDISAQTGLRRLLADHLDSFEGPRLLITHDPAEAFLLSDEVFVIEAGVVTQRGTPDEIRLAPRTPYVADLAGINLTRGVAHRGEVDTGTHVLHVADPAAEGPVIVTIHPTAVAVHTERPSGSPRNVWRTTIERTERVASRVRLRTGPPLPLTVEVTARSSEEMGLVPGAAVWLAVKATEISVSAESV